MIKLKIGDEISWRGCWGSEKAKVTTIIGIERTKHEHEKEGTPVSEIEWNETTSNWTFPFVADLSNGCWTYSYQLSPILSFLITNITKAK